MSNRAIEILFWMTITAGVIVLLLAVIGSIIGVTTAERC